MAQKLMQQAVKHPGALRAKAKRAGMSVTQYCSQGNLDATTKRQCNLARTFNKYRPKKGK